ncbi:pentapeptide repeat-containing protein [Actinomadura madurae]|uniref:pentapeptide repeat-containing protein n=1 Tax=Actinomadura madurae TaxID=1993 RepID=UPI003999580F
MRQSGQTPGYRPIKDAHKTLGLWSIRRALTFAFTAAVVLLVAAWFLVLWLLGSPSQAKPKPLETKDLLELLKLVFALVAGVGALVALVTAYRRQRVDEAAGERAERVQAHVEYGQAVELLGHDKAAVRLGGLYSLERLAQDHPYYRQTVIDVVCSYLRMPFRLPPTWQDPEGSESNNSTRFDPVATDLAHQELQVRLTVQKLLKRHLITTQLGEQDLPSYWENIDVDLSGAQLIFFDFNGCSPRDARFIDARFSGSAGFREARFSGAVNFAGAQFGEAVSFGETQFGGTVDFSEAHFEGAAGFGAARFGGTISFGGAQFNGTAGFGGAQFSGDAVFGGAQFNGTAGFGGAQFGGAGGFHGARFGSDAWFAEARFVGDARFGGGVQFSGDATFREARFGGDAQFRGAWFGGTAGFGGAQFSGTTRFHEAQFESESNFDGATVSDPNVDHAWPSSWRVQIGDNGLARLTRRDGQQR